MFRTTKRRIALISVDSDPATGVDQEVRYRNVYVRQVGEALARQGWQVDSFTRRSSAEQSTIVQHRPGYRTIRLAAGPQSIRGDELFHYLPEFVEQFRLFQQREGLQYRLIHTNHWLSSWVGMELKKRHSLIQVHTCHSLEAFKHRLIEGIPTTALKPGSFNSFSLHGWPTSGRSKIAATRLAVEKACLETADSIIATSPQEKLHMQTLTSAQVGVEMIPCGTDVDRFSSIQRQAARQRLGIASQAKVVLYVGPFSQNEGIETLVRAVAHSSLRPSADLRLVIAGGSPLTQGDEIERDRLKEIVAELGLGALTTFPGYLEDTVLPTYYAAADVCVIPSYHEPFGLAAVEAMASGTPVIASNLGGLQFTVVPEVTGLLVPPQDEVALAQAVDRVLTNPSWGNQMGQTGRQRAEIGFSWDSVASRLAHFYTQLLARPALPVHQAARLPLRELAMPLAR